MSQVVIGDILPYTQASATSGQTVFGTNWTANAASDVVVYRTPIGDSPNDVTQVLSYPSQYSVAFIGAELEVQVTLVSGATLGDIVTVTRQTPADRMNLYSNTNFLPSMLNNDFGILTLVDQQAQLVDQKIGPRYNYSATIVDVIDTILPILGANEAWCKNSNNTGFVAYTLPSSGIAPANNTYVTITDETATLPNSVNFAGKANGITIFSSGTFVTTNIVPVSLQTSVTNGSGVSGNISIGLASNTVIPGTAGMGIPSGTTAERITPTPPSIGLRFNTTIKLVEYYDAFLGTWTSITNDTALLALLASHTAGQGASLIGLEGTGTVQDLANATFILQSSSAAAPNGLVLTAGTNITLTPGVGTMTIASTPGTVNPGLINELAYYASAGDVLSGLATANNGVLITSAGGVPSISSTLPSTVQDNITRLGTITSGIWNGTAIDLAHGGTNANLTASNGGIFYSTSTAAAILAGTATANLPLLSGSSAAPIWAPFALSLGGALTTAGALTTSGAFGATFTFTNTTSVTFPTSGTLATTSQLPTPAALTKVDDTNVTLTLGGTPATALLQATSLTLGWTGQLGLTRGGTAASLTASTGGIVYSGASALAILAGTATANQIIMSGSSAAPAWSTATYPATTTINQLLYSSSANTIVGLATANNGILITSSGGVPSISSTLPNAVQDNITRLGTITSGTWTGTTIAVANGGTGVTSSNPVIQRVSTVTGAASTGTTAIPLDDTIPQNTEGDQYMSLAITPKSSSNILVIDVLANISNSLAGSMAGALFQDSTANALATGFTTITPNTAIGQIAIRYVMTAGTTSATTFKFRAGPSGVAGTFTFNGSVGARLYGGTLTSGIWITEYAA